MTSTMCPYCALAEKKGELFCSRHSANMEDLKSGIFVIRSSTIPECDYHITRLSININFTGPQPYVAGGREFIVKPGRMLILNEGQLFKTRLNSTQPNLSVTFAFKVGLATELKKQINGDAICDEQEPSQKANLEFIEKTYEVSNSLRSQMQSLVLNSSKMESWQLDDAMDTLLIDLLHLNRQTKQEILSINKVKASTRKEIYRRLHWGYEFIQENFQSAITIEDVAANACLSTFHFKRLFKELFKISPHQLIIQLRLNRAATLLKQEGSIKEVCNSIGWEDPSSFIRSFKKVYNSTPGAYRKAS